MDSPQVPHVQEVWGKTLLSSGTTSTARLSSQNGFPIYLYWSWLCWAVVCEVDGAPRSGFVYTHAAPSGLCISTSCLTWLPPPFSEVWRGLWPDVVCSAELCPITARRSRLCEGHSGQQHLTGLGVEWKFNAENAPWWGGIFEWMVRSTKRCLKKIIGQARLAYDELLTSLTEVEMVGVA